MLLDTIIVEKNLEKNIEKMMFFNNSLIKKKSCPAPFICKSKNINFFKLYKWKKFQTLLHNSKC